MVPMPRRASRAPPTEPKMAIMSMNVHSERLKLVSALFTALLTALLTACSAAVGG